MAYETIVYERKEGIGIITLNRPDRMNAINMQLVRELDDVMDQIEKDEEVRVVILAGHERFFCAGADIREEITPYYLAKLRNVFRKIECADKPFIAAISGVAFGGGCELSLVCDLRIASETARFGVPEIKIGIIPSGGGTQRLPRLVGVAKAKELLFSGDPIDASTALRIGLVNKVVPTDTLIDEAKIVAKMILERPPVAIRMAKLAVNVGIKVDLESGLDYEAQCASALLKTEDFREGITAFAEKRNPVWKGR